MISKQDCKLGWIRDYADIRDYDITHPKVDQVFGSAESKRKIIRSLKEIRTEDPSSQLPQSVDLRSYCPPIYNQGNLSSCTANAGVALFQTMENIAGLPSIEPSRLFTYKRTRDLMKATGDVGGYLRTTIQSMAVYGVCPEDYWPYDTDKFDDPIPDYCGPLAQKYKALTYCRLDPPTVSNLDVLTRIKTNLAAKLPAVFGFTVYNSIWDKQVTKTGEIPMPAPKEGVAGGHAIEAVGYDDTRKISNTSNHQNIMTMGAFIIRNSWSEAWGDKGYGYLPYDYVLKGIATDWWNVLSAEWFDMGQFDTTDKDRV